MVGDAEIGTPPVGHFSVGVIHAHVDWGSGVRFFQEQDMEVLHGGRSNSMVSYSTHTTVPGQTLLMGPDQSGAWQDGRPSAAPIRCMLNIYKGPIGRLRSAAQEFA